MNNTTDIQHNIVAVVIFEYEQNRKIQCFYTRVNALLNEDLERQHMTKCEENIKGETYSSDDELIHLDEYSDDENTVEWKQFWSLNGEKLIWQSWINKYSAYINPEFLVYGGEVEIPKFSSPEPPENSDNSVGLNIHSPQHKEQETDSDHLLTPRYNFHSSGSLRTIDSMTNVTQLTVSSIDSNTSSSDSLSSVSSVESSVDSTASEEKQGDNEQKWNELWKKHYQDEYDFQYKNFMGLKSDDFKNSLNLEGTAKSKLLVVNSTETSGEEEARLDEEEVVKMKSLGLPISFGTTKKKGKADLDPRDNVQGVLKGLGFKFSDENKKFLEGRILDYKKGNIDSKSSVKVALNKRKHIHFDEDGNTVENSSESSTSVTNSSDNSDNKLSSEEENITVIEQHSNPVINVEVDEQVNDTNLSRKLKRKKKNPYPLEIRENAKLKKYWHRRFSLFNRFDEGIKLDEESWYSVTPEIIAKHTAERCKSDIIIDAFCGAGGNTIQFARTCKKVIAIDIDPAKIEIARHNAKVYGVLDNIEFIVGDFIALAPNLIADIVFLSPPWGGPVYLEKSTYDLENQLQPVPYSKLMEVTKSISANIAAFLPKNTNTCDVMSYAGENGLVEIEQNFINGRLIAVTVYYNSLVRE